MGRKSKTLKLLNQDLLGVAVKTQAAELSEFIKVLKDRNLEIPKEFCEHDVLRYML